MDEANACVALARVQGPRSLEHRERPDKVRLHECIRAIDRPVYMRLCGEVEDNVRRIRQYQVHHPRLITDIGLHEAKPVLSLKRRQ